MDIPAEQLTVTPVIVEEGTLCFLNKTQIKALPLEEELTEAIVGKKCPRKMQKIALVGAVGFVPAQVFRQLGTGVGCSFLTVIFLMAAFGVRLKLRVSK